MLSMGSMAIYFIIQMVIRLREHDGIVNFIGTTGIKWEYDGKTRMYALPIHEYQEDVSTAIAFLIYVSEWT